MGKLLDDYGLMPGWVSGRKRCPVCGYTWMEVYHLWMHQAFHTMCPNCPERAAGFYNVVPFRQKRGSHA